MVGDDSEIGRCDNAHLAQGLLNAAAAAQLLGLSPKTLEKWRSEGKGPPVIRLGRRVAYSRGAIVQWLRGQETGRAGDKPVPPMKPVKVRPYFNDHTLWHVDMTYPCPTNPEKEIRKRVVAPAGLTMEGAKAWGEAERLRIVMELCKARPLESEGEENAPKKQEKKTKVPTLAEHWPVFEAAHLETKKYQTCENYKRARAHILPVLGDMRLDKIDRAMLARLRDALREKGCAPSYRNYVVDKLMLLLRNAVDRGLLAEDALPRDVKEKEEKEPEIDPLTSEEIELVMMQAESVHDEVILLLAWQGALRGGEIPALLWTDVDLWDAPGPAGEWGYLSINKNICKGRPQDTPKGEAGDVPISLRLADGLRRLRAKGHEGAHVLMRPDRPGVKPTVAHETDRSVEQRVALLLRRSGIRLEDVGEGVRPVGTHIFRHSALTHMFLQDIPLQKVQAFARHARYETTLKHYLHVKKKDKRNLARGALAAFGPAPDPAGVALAHSGNDLASTGNVVQIGRKTPNAA